MAFYSAYEISNKIIKMKMKVLAAKKFCKKISKTIIKMAIF